jgi:hypothetical protein
MANSNIFTRWVDPMTPAMRKEPLYSFDTSASAIPYTLYAMCPLTENHFYGEITFGKCHPDKPFSYAVPKKTMAGSAQKLTAGQSDGLFVIAIMTRIVRKR